MRAHGSRQPRRNHPSGSGALRRKLRTQRRKCARGSVQDGGPAGAAWLATGPGGSEGPTHPGGGWAGGEGELLFLRKVKLPREAHTQSWPCERLRNAQVVVPHPAINRGTLKHGRKESRSTDERKLVVGQMSKLS
ncbi:hypothetical protein MTO96_011613 [Rhipicephalus appendiculatus]